MNFFYAAELNCCSIYVLHKVDSLIELKEHEDLSLTDEADRNWTEVLDQTYIFNRKRREVNKSCIMYASFTY